jgi:hypothetical protein
LTGQPIVRRWLPSARWLRPLAHVVAQDQDDPFATLWREAELLGVIAHGAITELGRLVLADDGDGLRAHAAGLLPASADRATFGADLTVYVAGAPSARVSALLDSAADREGRGGAVTWRFSPASVRQALDEGATGDGLAAGLAAIATAGLPQPLRYLLADVARRHGNLRLTSATSCVRSDDEALLAEVACDRRLAKLGLRLLAPTVLASDAPLDQTLAALRKAGYFPVSDDPEPTPPSRPVSAGAEPPPMSGSGPSRGPRSASCTQNRLCADPRALAARACCSSPTAPTRPEDVSPTERRLSAIAKTLSIAEIRQLAHAIDTAVTHRHRVPIRHRRHHPTRDRPTRTIRRHPLRVVRTAPGPTDLHRHPDPIRYGRLTRTPLSNRPRAQATRHAECLRRSGRSLRRVGVRQAQRRRVRR